MKKLLMVPILALLVATVTPAAYANHGGAQSPDLEQDADKCRVEFSGHASCTVIHSDESGGPVNAAVKVKGAVPTADGWHVAFRLRVIDNTTGDVLLDIQNERTTPYIGDFLDVPVPNQPAGGTARIAPGPATDVTCLVDSDTSLVGSHYCTFDVRNHTVPLP